MTMTIFYVLLYYVWRQRYQIKGKGILTAAVYALASAVSEDKLDRRHILPDPLDKKTAAAIAKAVAQAAIKSGAARI